MRRVWRLTGVATVVVLAMFLVLPLVRAVNLGGHTIEFVGVETTAEGYYRWTYRVTSGGPPALSFWIIGFCGGRGAIVEATGSYEYTTDPHTGIKGIKFEADMEEGETRLFYFILRYAYPQSTDPVALGEKSGGSVLDGRIVGPVCDPPSVPEFGMSLSLVSLVGVVVVFVAIRYARKDR